MIFTMQKPSVYNLFVLILASFMTASCRKDTSTPGPVSETAYAIWSYNGQTYKSDKFFILNSTNPNCSKKTLLFNDTKNANALKFDYFDFSLGAGQSMQVDSKVQSCICCCRPSAGGNPAFVDCVEGSITMGANKTFTLNPESALEILFRG